VTSRTGKGEGGSVEQASPGEVRNARAVICLAEDDPAAALGAVAEVLDGTAPVLGYVTVVEAHLLAGLAHREPGDQRAANQAAERALALAESGRLVLPFAMTGSAALPEALPRHQIAGELSVSLNTVSTHLRSIYAKLQAGDRSSAVRRARELRLLAAGRTR
jgi:LuxR family transcriptional regulator, maltose regulon positive regulatory protein